MWYVSFSLRSTPARRSTDFDMPSRFYLAQGFYLKADFFPLGAGKTPDLLLLGPFNGRPACQQITPRSGKGVCADTFTGEKTLIVPDVEAYPGHIGMLTLLLVCREECSAWETRVADSLAFFLLTPSEACDGETKSEIVLPLKNKQGKVIGVLDLDSTKLACFDEDDRAGLEQVVEMIAQSCDWP